MEIARNFVFLSLLRTVVNYSQIASVPFQLQSLSQNRQLTPSSYDAQELTDTVMNILGLVVEDDTSDSPVARELAQVHIALHINIIIIIMYNLTYFYLDFYLWRL